MATDKTQTREQQRKEAEHAAELKKRRDEERRAWAEEDKATRQRLREIAEACPVPLERTAAKNTFVCGACGARLISFSADAPVALCATCHAVLHVPGACTCPACSAKLGYPETEWIDLTADGRTAEVLVGGAIGGVPGMAGAYVLSEIRDALFGAKKTPEKVALTRYSCGTHRWGLTLSELSSVPGDARRQIAARLCHQTVPATGVLSRAIATLTRDHDPNVRADALRAAAAVGTPALLSRLNQVERDGTPVEVERARDARLAVEGRDYRVHGELGSWNTHRQALCRRCMRNVELDEWRCPTCGVIHNASNWRPADPETAEQSKRMAEQMLGGPLSFLDYAVAWAWQKYLWQIDSGERCLIELEIPKLRKLVAKQPWRERLTGEEIVLGVAGPSRRPLVVTTRGLLWANSSAKRADAEPFRYRAYAEMDSTSVLLTSEDRISTGCEVVHTPFDEPTHLGHLARFLWEAAEAARPSSTRCQWCGSGQTPLPQDEGGPACRDCHGVFGVSNSATISVPTG